MRRKNFTTIVKMQWLVVTSLMVLTGCQTYSPMTKDSVKDSGPSQPVDVAHIPDAVPRVEPRTAAGNKSPYKVLGKTYHVMPDSQGYSVKGIASWYGRKFHGRRTSNGEIYNMYGMTAAHKTLPIPTFVEVKNLNNGNTVIVRVNDRGPFHGDRVIDLTYAAAKKLGFVDKGTAPVTVTAIDPVTFNQSDPINNGQPQQVVATNEIKAPAMDESAGYVLPDNTFLQAGAFGSRDSANALKTRLSELTQYPIFVETVAAAKQLFRVRIGPFKDNYDLMTLRDAIIKANLGTPHVVTP